MFFRTKKRNPRKADRHEAKGDQLFAQERYDKALKHYRKALAFDPGRQVLYDKLVKARDALPGDWAQEDFVESVSWIMHQQELANPSMKQVHARLSPEWQEAAGLAARILGCEPGASRDAMVEEFVGMGEIATRALIGLLLEMRAAAQGGEQPEQAAKPDRPIDAPTPNGDGGE